MENITTKQHYIPQVYLRGFSPEYELSKEKIVDNSKCTIYCYDLEKRKQSKAIPIKSVCYEKNLYEVLDNNGNVVLQNYIEKVFGKLEAEFSKYRNMLERKAFLPENYSSHMFLKHEEKAFWATYITLQLLRTPQVITVAEQTFNEVYGDSFKPNQARNIARIVCTPFFREIDDNTSEAMFFKALFQPMCDMSFGIFVDEKARFVTSDKTIYAHALSFPCDEYEKLIFPITSQLCLVMFGGEEKKACPKKNFLCPIDDEALASIFCAIVDASYNTIFSGHCLDTKEIKMINRIMDGVIDNEV